LNPDEINGLFGQLIEQAKSDLKGEGFADKEIALNAFLDLRYAGQGYELTVPAPLPPFKREDLEEMRRRFDAQHEHAHGHKAEGEPVELVSLRLVSLGLVPEAKLAAAKASGRKVEEARTGSRKVFFGKEHGQLDCAIYRRDRLEPGHKISGPAIVDQLDTTTVIHPEQEAVVDNYRNLLVTLK